MTNGRVPMTPAGEQALRAELSRLKKTERPAIIEAIAEARDHGDLKENAEYHAARERQGIIEGRIKDIESKLSNAQVIDVTKLQANGMVIFGATVTVINVDTEEETTYQIVGEDEADIDNHKISVVAPLARALIKKEVGDEIILDTPKGKVTYEIVDVEYK
ncbi:transcription elongation factor GreA [Francisella philomiragia]|uniref:Transcription elongation factor GreA n=1 Tax=Francisella philomiragia subsp. philomiragia (strain ATCC 25017 / CCUG 19701 / FSC 153 / O\|nr:transcription elongation factor GreA [Francisella philomiragia]B0TYL2.1 RecName: Full=Transcription elongation factor GreA; AltName: Full=Transcript cleavage factor GreA [Francisella philomiragia subsp. philomiragia ATCC 25017]EET21776.1 transcriptional elongation factor [Francisella philomiragia subsp. philomiragia ATCC 25015]MBK2020639.1 transcription elongation factor GreA [Francisella philomiragia]MBK2026470.1 transcription elongation factor GreA [Francisella philomiragia]MBK2030244.1 t